MDNSGQPNHSELISDKQLPLFWWEGLGALPFNGKALPPKLVDYRSESGRALTFNGHQNLQTIEVKGSQEFFIA